MLLIVALGALALGGYLFWRDHRPQPPSIRETLFNGFAALRGTIYSEEKPDDPRPTLYLAQDNRAHIDQPMGAVYNAISGLPLIVEKGNR